MQPERWEKVKQILAVALELEPLRRPAYLSSVCAGDQSLLQEVLSLVEAHDKGGSQIDHPASPSRALEPGDKLDVYQIEELIGAGGMGEVYRALDTKLGCQVAIKVLPSLFASDPARVARFEKEARATAALNHPNILFIRRLGTHGEMLYIASELLVGKSLRDLLKENPLPPATVVDYAMQIASGLAAAHSKGIVHRDIKPENLFVTEDNQIKILDFGLAKLADDAHGDGTVIAKRARHATDPGTALGTVAYMSPEQARGEAIGPASDVFSFGIVLYEMTTGSQPFRGTTTAVIHDAILNRDPAPPTQLNPLFAPELCTIVSRALEKSAERRYQNASEMRRDLQQLKEDSEVLRVLKRKKRPSLRARSRALLAVGVIAMVALAAWYNHTRHLKLTERDTIVLADFVNTTGDPVFDDTLRTALTISLRQSPFLNLLPEDKVAATLRLMVRPTSTPLTPDVAREVCERAGSKAYIAGSIASLGSQYVVGLKAVNCQNGNLLVEEQATASSKERVLSALGREASKLRGELGESLGTVAKYDVPLVEATTTSLEALKEYSLGERALFQTGFSATALAHHLRAVQLDPKFAMAYSGVGSDYNGLGELGRAAEYFTKAFQLQEHISEPEKLAITGAYYSNVTNELDKAARNYEESIQAYPRYYRAYLDLGNMYAQQGQYASAKEKYAQSLHIAPDHVGIYANLTNAMLASQQFDEIDAIWHTIQRTQPQEVDDFVIRNAVYALAFLRADVQGMAEQQHWFAGRTEENIGYSLASDTEAYAGHLRRARELTLQSVNSAIRADSKETGALWEEIAAQREVAFGNRIAAREDVVQGLKLYPGSESVQVEAALGFAMAGDTAHAESLAQDLNHGFPLDTQVQSLWLPAIRAQLALNRKDPVEAISDLRSAELIEFAQIPFTANLSCLYHTYIRGEAYLAEGQGSAAALEFQKILDHNGLVWNCWTGALAHLGVARANALEAKTLNGAEANTARDRARVAYKDFLTLWKDADPDIPVLKEARLEYEKLQ